MVLRGLKNIMYNYSFQPEVATYMFDATGSNELNYSEWERCVIWNHFDRAYNIPGNTGTKFLPQTFSGSNSDLYMKDDVDDLGIEENPATTVMYLSEDIWVRPTDDDEPFHDNPEYRNGPVDKKNYVYVKVRSKGCELISDATLHVYWSKASTGLAWSTHWDNYYIGNVLAGDEIGTVDLDALNIEAGEERIVKLEWIPPNPDDFNDAGKHHYCLLARIVSDNDDMHCSEGPDVNANTKCNNNIVWKNVTVLSVPGFTTDTATVFVRDVLGSTTGNSCLQLTVSTLPHFTNPLDNANISLQLRDSLKIKWIAGGSYGSGFSYDSESGLFNVTSFPVTFCGINLTNMKEYLLDLYVEGTGNPQPFAFDLKHYKGSPTGTLVGGERFIYPGTGSDALPRSNNKPIAQSTNQVTSIPNPFQNSFRITFENLISNFTIKLFDVNSKLLLSKQINNHTCKDYLVDLEHLQYKGVIIMQISSESYNKAFKLIKN